MLLAWMRLWTNKLVVSEMRCLNCHVTSPWCVMHSKIDPLNDDFLGNMKYSCNHFSPQRWCRLWKPCLNQKQALICDTQSILCVLYAGYDEFLLTLLIYHIILVMNPHMIVLLPQGIHVVQTVGCWIISVNSVLPVRCLHNVINVVFKHIAFINALVFAVALPFGWIPQDLTDQKSMLVQVLAWCLEVRSHYMCECWLNSMSIYDITRPKWFELNAFELNAIIRIKIWNNCKVRVARNLTFFKNHWSRGKSELVCVCKHLWFFFSFLEKNKDCTWGVFVTGVMELRFLIRKKSILS